LTVTFHSLHGHVFRMRKVVADGARKVAGATLLLIFLCPGAAFPEDSWGIEDIRDSCDAGADFTFFLNAGMNF